jgi:hypothetical protein
MVLLVFGFLFTRFSTVARRASPIFGGAQNGVSEPLTYLATTMTLLFINSSTDISILHSDKLIF